MERGYHIPVLQRFRGKVNSFETQLPAVDDYKAGEMFWELSKKPLVDRKLRPIRVTKNQGGKAERCVGAFEAG
jgi:hypothetical protein